MIHYLLLRSDGTIFQRGVCPSEDEIPQIPGMTAEVITPDDARQPPGPPPPTYKDMRRGAYPSMGAQMDALWHAMDQGIMPKVEPFYSEILAVKQQFPKPSN